jgi:adenosylhomocysteine nucleosidase
MNVLFVFPSEREASVANFRRAPLVCDSGTLAGDVVAAELSESRPDLVLLSGFCGSLDPSLKPGSLILGRQVIAPGEDVIDPDRLMVEEIRSGLRASGLPFVYSRLLTVPAPAATRAAKRELWNEFGAGGVDMETYWVAEACRKARVNWIAVRAVLDTSSQALPRSLHAWERPGDEALTAAGAIRHPAEWPAYVRLASQYRAARRSLAAALPHVVRAVRDAKTVETLELV